MQTSFDRINSGVGKAVMVIVALTIWLATAQAQTGREPTETIIAGRTVPIGLVQGETLRFTAFNPSETDGGRANEAITLQLKLFDKNGNEIAASPRVVIPPGEFRWVEFNRDALPISGEPGNTRAQFRTMPLWGLRARPRITVSTSLEILNNTNAGTFRFFLNVETLP